VARDLLRLDEERKIDDQAPQNSVAQKWVIAIAAENAVSLKPKRRENYALVRTSFRSGKNTIVEYIEIGSDGSSVVSTVSPLSADDTMISTRRLKDARLMEAQKLFASFLLGAAAASLTSRFLRNL